VSGEAGASLQSEYYTLFLGSGVRVSVAPPPGDDGSAVGRYFEEQSAPYAAWLARARPALDALFTRWAAEGVPLARWSAKHEQVDGVIIEDQDRPQEAMRAAHFRTYHRGGPCVVRVGGGRRLAGVRSLNLALLVTTRVERTLINQLLDQVAEVVTAAEIKDGAPR